MSQSNIGRETVIKALTIVVAVGCASIGIFKKGVKKGLNKAAQAMEAAKTTVKIQREENERLRRENDELRKQAQNNKNRENV